MKLLLFGFTLLIATVLANQYTQDHDGRPACKTQLEMEYVDWRNNMDPTKYWKCLKINEPAVEEPCPSEYLFKASERKCVFRTSWLWTPLEDPPSLA